MLQSVPPLFILHVKEFERRVLVGRAPLGLRRLEQDHEDLGMGVVDGHPELQVMTDSAIGLGPLDVTQRVGEDERVLVDPRWVPFCLTRRRAPLHDAVIELDELVRLLVVVHLLGEMGGVAVQPEQVRGIDRVLHRLQPVALQKGVFLHPAFAMLPGEHVPARQRRRRVGAEIGEQQAAELHDRIGGVPYFVLEGAAGGLRRLLEAMAAGVELPAVIGAADALVIDPPVGERGAPVGTVLAEEAIASLGIPKDHQVLAEDPDRPDRLLVGQFACRRHRLPVAAQQLSRGRSGAHTRQPLVFFTGHHGRATAGLVTNPTIA